MKKLLFLLLALPLFAVVSCGDDKEPNVNVYVRYHNATVVDGVAYIVKDSLAAIDSLWVEAVDKGHIATIISPVRYITTTGRVGVGTPGSNAVILPSDTVYAYGIAAQFDVAETDCELAACVAGWDIKVVADSASIPTGGQRDAIVQQHKHQ